MGKNFIALLISFSSLRQSSALRPSLPFFAAFSHLWACNYAKVDSDDSPTAMPQGRQSNTHLLPTSNIYMTILGESVLSSWFIIAYLLQWRSKYRCILSSLSVRLSYPWNVGWPSCLRLLCGEQDWRGECRDWISRHMVIAKTGSFIHDVPLSFVCIVRVVFSPTEVGKYRAFLPAATQVL